MKGYLLDTNVISEYTHAKPPAERVRNWIDTQDEKDLYLSVLTLGEIPGWRRHCFPCRCHRADPHSLSSATSVARLGVERTLLQMTPVTPRPSETMLVLGIALPLTALRQNRYP